MFSRTLTLALASSFVLGMTGFFAPKANAQTVNTDVPFSGSVPIACDFDAAPTAGVLDNTTDPLILTSADGSAGLVSITCNTVSGTLAIAAPSEGSGNPVTANTLTSSMSLTGANTVANVANDSNATLSSMGTTDVEVDMSADFSTTYTQIPGGTYSYNVQLTLTP